MTEKVKISQRQFAILVTIFTVGSSILILPAGLAKEAKQDAWIVVLLGLGVGVLLVALCSTLGNRYASMNLAEYSEIILGKWVGKVVTFLYFAFFFTLSALVLRNIGSFLSTYELVQTPIEATQLFFLLVVIMALRLGLETFTRTAEFFFPWVLFLFLIFFIFISPDIDFKNLQPVMENGVKPIVRASIPFIGSPLLELVVFLMILPAINRTQGRRTGFLAGYLIGGSILFVVSIYTLLVLGDDLTARHIYPTYDMAQQINIGNFIQRVEVIVSFSWFITMFIKLTICFYACASCLVYALKLKDNRSVIIPLAIIMLIFSLLAYPNTAYFLTFFSETWPAFALVYGLFIPLLLLILSIFKEKFAKVNRDPKA